MKHRIVHQGLDYYTVTIICFGDDDLDLVRRERGDVSLSIMTAEGGGGVRVVNNHPVVGVQCSGKQMVKPAMILHVIGVVCMTACLVVGDEVIGTSFVESEEGGVFEGDLVLGKIDMEGKAIFNPANSEIVREVLRTQSSELMARVEAELVPEPNVGDQSGLFKNPAVNPTTPRNNAEEWTIDKFVINHEDLAESRLSLSGNTLSAN